MLKIVLTGPESCGKTTLARQLAAHFNAPLVEEYVREYFEKKGTPQYKEADLKKIAKGQISAEKKALTIVNQQIMQNKIAEKDAFIICDTDVLTIKIWAEEKKFSLKFDVSSLKLEVGSLKFESAALQTSNVKLQTIYLLCSPEGIAWEADPLRENPNDRDRLFDIYEQNLNFYQKTYFILRGSIFERFELAKEVLMK